MEKRPCASAERLVDVVAAYPTPLQVYDERTIRSRVRALLDAFSWNQGFREYFAVKATPTPAILRLLADMGCGCDCATSTELVMAEACGVSGRRVMLSSSDTPDETYRIAHGMGAIVNLDGLDMVDATLADKAAIDAFRAAHENAFPWMAGLPGKRKRLRDAGTHA